MEQSSKATIRRSSPLDAALAYHQLGLRVVLLYNVTITKQCSCKLGASCKHAGKHPRMNGWNKPGAGMLETPDDIRDAFSRYPRANVGLLAGGPPFSNAICLDVDPKHDGDKTLAALLEKHGPLPETWRQRTPSGGEHIWFLPPGPEWVVANSQADEQKKHPKLGTGLDIKSDKGQAVVYPSTNLQGKYEWINAPGGTIPLATMPEWLRDMIAQRKEDKKRKETGQTQKQRGGNTSLKAKNNWARAALKNEIESVRRAPEGNRNNILNIASMNLFQIVANGLGLLEADVIIELLMDAAREAWGHEFEPTKARDTIESGRKKGMNEPRMPPARDEILKTSLKTVDVKSTNKHSRKATIHPNDLPDFVKENKDDSYRLARIFMEGSGYFNNMQRLYYWQDTWYHWKSRQNVYHTTSRTRIASALYKSIRKTFLADAEEEAAETGKSAYCKNITRKLLNDVICALESMCQLEESTVKEIPSWIGHPDEEKRWISVHNGLIDLDAIEGAETAEDVLSEPTPQWFSTSCMPVTFDPAAQCPLWDRFLSSTFNNDHEIISMVQEWFGYCLTHETKYQKFLTMISEGGHGKGVIIGVMNALIGDSNMSSVPLEKFAERFDLYQTLGMQVNLISDANELDKVAEGHLKSFVVGDPMFFDRKGLPGINTRPTAKLMLVTNKLPHFSDRSQGVWRRMLIVHLTNVIAEGDQIAGMDKPEFWNENPEELSGILNWAIAGLHRLTANGRFTVPLKVVERVEQHKVDCDNVRRFLADCCILEPGNVINSQDMYGAYRAWCRTNGFGQNNINNFAKTMFDTHPAVTRKKCGGRGNRYWAYEGIDLDIQTAQSKTSWDNT